MNSNSENTWKDKPANIISMPVFSAFLLFSDDAAKPPPPPWSTREKRSKAIKRIL
jgi:hypothetical protein